MLSKSDFTQRYLDCPCALWLHKQRPDLMPDGINAHLEGIFEQGRLVDEEAKKLFPGGLNVEGFVYDGWAHTAKLLKSGNATLFQPTAVFGQLHARADILTKGERAGTWDLREVKSSTAVKDDHYIDLAFQRVCFEGAGIPIGKTWLIHVNNRYVRRGAIDVHKLLKTEDVTAEVKEAMRFVKKEIPKALAVIAIGKKPDERNVRACTDPESCEYLGRYLQLLPAALRKKLEDLRREEPKPNPPIVEIDKAGIREALSELSYPLHFLDYETFSPAVPMFDGYRPYQRVTFQYSMHVIESPESRMTHFHYLEKGLVDPTPKLAAHIRDNTKRGGTFIAWNAGFEKGCNMEMGDRDPRFAKFFASLNDRMFDLMLLFKKRRGLYFHSGFEGSASLKNVMPAIVPFLSYKSLNIQEGGTASNSWPILTSPKTLLAQKKRLYKDMLAYCDLDTLAMVEILKHLQKVSK